MSYYAHNATSSGYGSLAAPLVPNDFAPLPTTVNPMDLFIRRPTQIVPHPTYNPPQNSPPKRRKSTVKSYKYLEFQSHLPPMNQRYPDTEYECCFWNGCNLELCVPELGKHMKARHQVANLHGNNDKPCLWVNCGAVPSNLYVHLKHTHLRKNDKTCPKCKTTFAGGTAYLMKHLERCVQECRSLQEIYADYADKS